MLSKPYFNSIEAEVALAELVRCVHNSTLDASTAVADVQGLITGDRIPEYCFLTFMNAIFTTIRGKIVELVDEEYASFKPHVLSLYNSVAGGYIPEWVFEKLLDMFRGIIVHRTVATPEVYRNIIGYCNDTSVFGYTKINILYWCLEVLINRVSDVPEYDDVIQSLLDFFKTHRDGVVSADEIMKTLTVPVLFDNM